MRRLLSCVALFCLAFGRAAATQEPAPIQTGETSQSLRATTPGLITARWLCEEGRHLEAIDLFDRILESRIESDAAGEVDAALDRCMRLVDRADDSQALLAAIRQRPDRPSGLKALSVLARREVYRRERCDTSGPLYRELVDLHGSTREAARVILGQATRCLGIDHDDDVALHDLEAMADFHAGRPEGALALYELGNYYRFREDRSRAAVYYQKLIDSYPETLEDPRLPGRGRSLVKLARTDLDLLHLYLFSPRLDRIKDWVQSEVLVGLLHLDVFDAISLAIVLVPWLVHLGALGLIIVLIPLFRRRSEEPDGSLLNRSWTVWQASLVLIGCWTLALLLQLLSMQSFLSTHLESVWSFLNFNGGTELILAAAVFVTVLRGEPLGRVFAIDRRRLVRLLLWTAGSIVGTAVVAGLVLAALMGLGIVNPGSDLDRFLSTEGFWPSEWWSFGLVLVVLSAVTEEVLFRGVLHEALRRVVPIPVSAGMGSFVFAMIHVRPVPHTVAVFVIGITFVLLRERFRSLAPGSIVHSLWNLLSYWLR